MTSRDARKPAPLLAPAEGGTERSIRTYALYGEDTPVTDAAFLHIEDIRSRSQRYDWEIGTHAHRGLFQLIMVMAGRVDMRADDREYSVDGPAVMAIPPGVVHAFRFSPGTVGHALTVGEAQLFGWAQPQGGGVGETLLAQPRCVAFGDGSEAARRVHALLELMLAEFRTPLPGREAIVETLLHAALLLVVRQMRSSGNGAGRERLRLDLFTAFRHQVEEHFLDHWPVARYAEALNVTESRLNRLCRALAEKSAFDLIQERLLLEARRRLTYVAVPVSLLAYELGFQDPAYFCRFFKKHTGVTPSGWRRRG